ncbi:MAG: o-succinylbenzoate synthase [Flammeovirgaceae bacterium]|jgi:O-succinylbenzoate synthase|nr:o-succinylbenzoate synthase [Flammeovirgaceae bacterium]
MALRVSIHKKVFQFNFDARTSRGPMKNRTAWFIKLWNEFDSSTFGLGECAPLEGLSKETEAEMDSLLASLELKINNQAIELPSSGFSALSEINGFLLQYQLTSDVSSICFGMETALLDLANGGVRTLFKTDFLKGVPIPINGLIWIGGLDYMLQQIDIKIKDGFRCIKIKVGSLNFEKECDILQYIRRKYYREDIVVRLDANGAFKPDEAMFKLLDMSRFGIHSIEQPLKPGAKETELLCKQSPIPIAFDEELIGVNTTGERKRLLEKLRPAYIILKPSLHGGLFACQEWIALAEELKIGWWMTSALESSVGLNAIAQFTSTYSINLPQGLGTGQIYENNIESPLIVKKGQIYYNQLTNWDLSSIFPPEKESEEVNN